MIKFRSRLILSFILVLFLFINLKSDLNGQDTVPNATFSYKKIKIGQPVRYHLSYRHDKKHQIIFPNSKTNFSPFELVSKEFYTTKTIGRFSLDSAVYVLRTFELKDTISYFLPIYEITPNGDSISLKPKKQLVLIDLLTKLNTYDFRLKEMIIFNPIQPQVNYVYYFIIGSIIFIITSLIFLFFRKTIVKRIKLYTIRKSFYSFTKNFEKLEKDFIKMQHLPLMENALSLWKVYLTKLEDIPINTYTTTEIISLFRDGELAEGLQIIDKSIYRGMISGEPEKALAILRKFSLLRYQQIKRKIFNER